MSPLHLLCIDAMSRLAHRQPPAGQPMVGKRLIFVHGMGPKPPKQRHLQQWQEALRYSLWTELPPEATAMAYWADLRYRQAVPQVRGNLLEWFKRRVLKALWRD